MTRFVIIGAGECGVRAALALREQGFDGSIDLVHGEAVMPYERPPLSKPGESSLIAKPISGSHNLNVKSIQLHMGVAANKINRATQSVALSDGMVLPYDQLLIATGAQPRKLTLHGSDIPNIRYLRTFEDAQAIHQSLLLGKRLTIIGGGFIGLELAAFAARAGVLVTVLEAGPRLLGRAVPAEIASIIEARHRAERVDLRYGVSIVAIDQFGTITLGDGRMDNGISVNETLRTSDPLIFAAGDCCSFPHALYGGMRIRIESWRAAQEQGDHVARSMLGSTEPYSAVPWFWSDQYDLTLQIAGLSGNATVTIRRTLGEHNFILFHLDTEGRLLAASGIGLGNSIARDIRLAEMLIAKRAHPDPSLLADPDAKLKALLSAG